MDVSGGTQELVAPGGGMPAEVCAPTGDGPFPGLLLIMEAYGLNAHIRSLARSLASEGYVVLAPDLYYRETERTVAYSDVDRAADRIMRTIALSDAPEERVKDDRVIADLEAAVEALKAHDKVAPSRLGVVGFAMGGRLAFLSACRLSRDLRAAVSFYGGRIVPIVEECRSLEAPILLLFGGKDPGIPLAQVDRIQAELSYRGKAHAVEIYPEAGHGFFCEDRPSYCGEATADARRRTLSWLEKHLS